MSIRDGLQEQRDARAAALARVEQYSANAADPFWRRRWSRTVTELTAELVDLDAALARLDGDR